MTTVSFFRASAWAVLAFIIFVTVSPIDLRPHTMTTVSIDRASAYACAAVLFVLAYPKQWKLAAVLLVFGAMGIELLQYLSPSRHPHLSDATVKSGGAAIGILIGHAINLWRRRVSSSFRS